MYDKHGREGLAAGGSMKPSDMKPIIRAVFGGGNFAGIFGDVCTLPSLKMMLDALGKSKEESEQERLRRDDPAQRRLEAKEGVFSKKMRTSDIFFWTQRQKQRHEFARSWRSF